MPSLLMAVNYSSVYWVWILLIVCVGVWIISKNRSNLPLPPNPPGLPFIGQGQAIAGAARKGELHLLFNRWARQYGDIFRVQIGPETEIYINSDRAVKEIFDRASAYTSERPSWIVSSEMMCNKLNVLLLHASDPRWKHHRRVINSALTSLDKANSALPLVYYETTKFLHEVATSPQAGTDSQELWRKIGRYTYSVLAMQTYGFEIPGPEYPVVDYIFNSGIEQILGTLPGSYLVDVFPWLNKLPRFLKSWERKAQRIHQSDWNWACERLKRVKTNMQKGSFQDAFLPRVLRDENKLGFPSEEEAAYLCLLLIQGGADTSKMSTWSFLEAMMTYPDVQDKARREIDTVVGDRLPVWDDIEGIPYVRCLMKEVWRWRPPVALGHPHVTTRDISYGPYIIPKASKLHLNSWAISHDPRRHEDPDRFWPERYADDLSTSQESINAKDPSNRDHFAFGAGRRVCPGYHVAERSLAVTMMRLLWAFDIRPAPHAKLPLDPKDYRGELIGIASPEMPVSLVVLSEKKKRLIATAYEIECQNHASLEEL